MDVNVLIYAHREDAARHPEFREWLEQTLSAPSSFAFSDHILSGFLRVVTHPKVFSVPTPLARALEFTTMIRTHPKAIALQPGYSHWNIFSTLCRETNAKGNLIADAYLAALAIENDCEWISTDHDFTRFKGLKWRHPLGG